MIATMPVLTPEIPVIDLVHPLPGFPEHHRFALVQLDDDGVLCQLRSLDDPSLFRPAVAIFVKGRPDWAVIPEGLEVFDGLPD